MNKSKEVNEYIANAPGEMREKLELVRVAIREAAPEAEERISYGIPYYDYKGKLAYFSFTKNHIGLYVVPPVVEEHKEELKKYFTSKSTVRFPINEELPNRLIKKLVKARVKMNDASDLEKKSLQ